MTHLLIGFIPVGGGAGWDGSVYLDYIAKIAAGHDVIGDPYRLIRVSGFLPAILAARLGVEGGDLIKFQFFVNVFILSSAIALLFSTIYFLTNKKWVTLVAAGTIFFSWPYLVMPVYYPILSDHLALAISIVAIWAWSKSRKEVLQLLIFFSCWVMPGLFIVPVLLAMMPIEKAVGFYDKEKNNKVASMLAFFGVVSIFYYFVSNMFNLSDHEILSHPQGLNIGAIDLKYWTFLFVLLGFLGVSLVTSQVVGSVIFWRNLSWQGTVLALAMLAIGFASIRLLVNWDTGFRGPPLLYFLALQASAAPLKSVVAHFLYFGPIFVVAMISCIFYKNNFRDSRSFPLFVVLLAFLPILLMGSESRQWIAVFPVAVVLVAMNQFNIRVLLLFLIFSVILCIPAFFLREGMMAAFGDPAQKFSSEGWQLYFGRQGPWMSLRTYVIGLVSMLVFFILYNFCQTRNYFK